MVTARRFADLGVSGEELPCIEPVDTVPRRMPAPEQVDDHDADNPLDGPGSVSSQVTPIRSTAGRQRDANVEV